MSWFGGYKPKTSEKDSREEKRRKLEKERLKRAQARADTKKQLQEAQAAQAQLGEAIDDLLALNPDILSGESVVVSEEEARELLETSDRDIPTIMDFDSENGVDGEKAMDKMGSVKCEFSKDDIEFWFSELETQLEVIEVKSQWSKRIALQRFLPAEVKQEVKSLLIIPKAQAGEDIYKRIKSELLDLFGQKPEDAYIRAKNRIMTGKPSQLGKALINDICKCPVKLQSGCCAQIIWGMYREALPVVIRNHIAEMKFNKDTYKDVFKKSDQVYDSNKPGQAVRAAPVAATTSSAPSADSPEVAAFKPQRGGFRGGRGYRGGGRGNGRGAANSNQAPSTPTTTTTPSNPQNASNSNRGTRHATAKGDSEKLCKIHFKWGENGSYCAAPWKCPMKSVFKAPQ